MKQYILQTYGNRRNYDVAETLHEKNMLISVVTDFYCHEGKLRFSKMLNERYVKTLSRYYNNKIPDILVKSSWFTGFCFRVMRRMSSTSYDAYCLAGKLYSIKTKNEINKTDANAIYGYDGLSLESFKYAKKRGLFLAMEQCIAPRSSQIKMYQKFEKQYGLSFQKKIIDCKKFMRREKEEWALADVIIAHSSYVKRELIAAGVDDHKIKIVHKNCSIVSNNVSDIIEKRFAKKQDVFRIIFAGNDMLRKGVQDIAEIAQKLKDENIEFRIVGSFDMSVIEKFGINKIPNIKLLGKLDKTILYREYENADLFILPSYLEGSAMVTVEALNFGLPAIVTEQSGSFITSGIDGYVCEAGDIEFMISHILELKNNDKLRYSISKSTISLLKKTSIETYHKNLIEALK